MKILFFVRLFYPHIGGVEKHAYEIGRRLIEEGHHVSIVTEQFDTIFPEKETYQGFTIYRIPVIQGKIKKFQVWFWLVKHLNLLLWANVIHCHDIFFWYVPFRFLFPQKKVFTTFHGYEGNSIPGVKAKYMHKIAEKLSFGNMCVGAFFEKWYGTKATVIIYGGVDLSNSKYQISNIKKSKNINAVFVGRLEEETGIMTYLEAMNMLQKKGNKISLEVLGDGAQRQEAEIYARKHNLLVKFLGFISDPSSCLEKADIVFVSRYLGILEAFAKQKPVFAVYNNAIKKDYLMMTPFADYMVVEESGKEIAAKLTQFANNKDQFETKTEKAYAWVQNQTWDILVHTYHMVWSLSLH